MLSCTNSPFQTFSTRATIHQTKLLSLSCQGHLLYVGCCSCYCTMTPTVFHIYCDTVGGHGLKGPF
jgi:hypothetical protein